MDGGAWRATVCWVTKSRPRLGDETAAEAASLIDKVLVSGVQSVIQLYTHAHPLSDSFPI